MSRSFGDLVAEAESAGLDVTGPRMESPRTLHDRIQAEGPFVAYATRFLIEARKPGG